ncbi:MAG: dihydroorotate dehydrogenase electron transfer subunit [Candidatus Sumerlaeota bacterium]|nr:dihydroorotate dehydrogenase electron transfer subunit [Candidatus Sumerlaeota bacterium]
MKQCLAPLVESRPLGPGLLLHTYHDSDIAAHAKPGQFINVRVSGATAPLLRRPFSLCDADPAAGRFSVLFRVVGEGTEALARAGAGDRIDLMGPLGTAFQWEGVERALLVAGGVGVAPLHFLASQIWRAKQAERPAPRVVFAYGARDSGGLALADDIEKRVDLLAITTEDGSRGQRGLVTAALDPHLAPDTAVFCCGPTPMMAAVLRRMRERGLKRGWFSLENQMGCGVGVCLGCVVPTRDGYRRVCCDGPVLPAAILDFTALCS